MDDVVLRCGHLLNGIGGFPLAARWMGWRNVWHSEIDDFCNKVTKKNFPNSKCYGDIKTTKWKQVEPVDLITGGFPCQPFSVAGEKRGTKDERHLWPEMLKTIGVVKPRWVVGENVYGIVNWSDGMVFEQVQADLENEGYQVQPYILPAAAVNAPHRRDRVWFVAYADNPRTNNSMRINGEWEEKNERRGRFTQSESRSNGSIRNDTNSSSYRPQGRDDQGKLHRKRAMSEQRSENVGKLSRRQWKNFPTQPPVCGGNDGVPNRVDRIKALGNAIVPQVAYNIFKAIHKYETSNNQ